MKERGISYADAKKIPITDYLSSLGFRPARIRGTDYWYHSPFREERTPSFKVNTRSNVWFDHGTGEGGTILDLGSRLHRCTLQEFAEKLFLGNYVPGAGQPRQFSNEETKRKLDIISVSPLTSPDLIHYLSSRGIDIGIARKYCFETEFTIRPGTYTAVGFPNRSGGYELRNKWFKGSSSPKDVSIIKGPSSSLCVTEGFIDFLSILMIDDRAIKNLTINSSFLILNSLALLNRSLPVLQSHADIHLFLDNDFAGKDAVKVVKEKGIQVHNASDLFGAYKDANEYLIDEMKNKGRQYFTLGTKR